MQLRVVGLGEVGSRVVAAALARGHAVTRIERDDAIDRSIAHDATLICVGTSSDRGEFDGGAIERALSDVAAALAPEELIAIESTVPPRWTETIGRELVERISGAQVGEDVFLVAAPGRTDSTLATRMSAIPKVVGGVTPACTARGVAVYAELVEHVVPVADAATAEAAKLLENAFRFVNVAFANEMAELLASLEIDARSVIDAAATKPFGFMPFWPSAGIGGECIPLAGSILRKASASANVAGQVIKAALASEAAAPERTLRMIAAIHGGRPSPVLIAGLAYKSLSDSFAQSPGLRLARFLSEANLEVDVIDPHLRAAPVPGGARPVTRKTLRPHYEVAVIAAWQPEFRELVNGEIATTIVDLSGSPPDEGSGS